jgi:hypothetical protein
MERTKPCNCNHSDRYKTYLGLIDTKVDTTIKSFNYRLKKIKDLQLRKTTFTNEVENLRRIFNPSITKTELAKTNSNVISFPRINFNYIEEIGIIEQLRGEARRFNNKEKLVSEFHSPDCEYLEYWKFNGKAYLYPYIHWFETVYPFFVRLSLEYAKSHKSEINWNIYKLDNRIIGKLYIILKRYKWIEINKTDFKLIFNGNPKTKEIKMNWIGTKAALQYLMRLLKEEYFQNESYESVYQFINNFSSKEIHNRNKKDEISLKDKKVIESIKVILKS